MNRSRNRNPWEAVRGVVRDALGVADKRGLEPRQVYRQLLRERRERYQELRNAVARLIYLEQKCEGDIHERRAEIARLYDQAKRCIRRGDDPRAMMLIEQKDALLTELASAEEVLAEARERAEAAKALLLSFREETRSLELEAERQLTALSAAEASERVRELFSRQDDRMERRLEVARAQIERVVAEQALERELAEVRLGKVDVWEEERLAEARLELRRLKNRMRLAPAALPASS